jgi:hypothetical protein
VIDGGEAHQQRSAASPAGVGGGKTPDARDGDAASCHGGGETGRCTRALGGMPGDSESTVIAHPAPSTTRCRRHAPQSTVMENVRSVNAPAESVARRAKLKVPRVVGVPVIRPGLEVSWRPGGSVPATRLQR